MFAFLVVQIGRQTCALNNRIWNQIINYMAPVETIIFIQKRWMTKNFMEKEEFDGVLNRVCSLGEQSTGTVMRVTCCPRGW